MGIYKNVILGILSLSVSACLSGGGQGSSKKSNASSAKLSAITNEESQPTTSGVIGRRPAYNIGNIQIPSRSGQNVAPSNLQNPNAPIAPPNPYGGPVAYPVDPINQGNDGIPGQQGTEGTPGQGSGGGVASDQNLPPEIMPGCRGTMIFPSGNRIQVSLHAVLNSQGACITAANYLYPTGSRFVSSGDRMPPGVKNLNLSGNRVTFTDPCPAGHGNQYIVEYYTGPLSTAGSGWTIGHTGGPAAAACPTPEDPSWRDAPEARTDFRGWKRIVVSSTSVTLPEVATRVRVKILNRQNYESGFGNCLGACSYTYWRQAYFPQSL